MGFVEAGDEYENQAQVLLKKRHVIGLNIRIIIASFLKLWRNDENHLDAAQCPDF